jgi:hypothetical protein
MNCTSVADHHGDCQVLVLDPVKSGSGVYERVGVGALSADLFPYFWERAKERIYIL